MEDVRKKRSGGKHHRTFLRDFQETPGETPEGFCYDVLYKRKNLKIPLQVGGS